MLYRPERQEPFSMDYKVRRSDDGCVSHTGYLAHENESEARGKGRRKIFNLFNRLWDCPEEGSSNPGLGSIMSIVAREFE